MSSQHTKVRGVADFVFLIDVTGSMRPCLDALKNNIGLFIDTLTNESTTNDRPLKSWRGKVVGYRDFQYDDFPAIEDNPFVADVGALKRQLAALVPDGGGDEPESLLDAIHHVASMGSSRKGANLDPNQWRYASEAARVVIVFTDASYHQRMLEPDGGTLDDVFNVAQQERIVLNLFAPDMPCHEALAALDGSEYHPIDHPGLDPRAALAKFTSDQKNFAKVLQALAKSVSASAVTVL